VKIKFWGVRGSISCPGPETVVYGGNTPCLELRFDSLDRYIIIDAGSGIRPLGNFLMKNDLPKGPIHTDIFFTHTHWDHIMGFPFFSPIYTEGTRLDIHGPITYEEDTLEDIIGGQLRYRYFPVMHSELSAEINYHDLTECSMDLGDGISIKTKYLNHTLLCLGYRIEYEGKVICTAYDTEPFRNVFTSDPLADDYDEVAAEEGEAVAREENEKLIDFYRGADILIHDAQYTLQEYNESKTGWGHSAFEHAIDAAIQSEVKTLVLFHHEPERPDSELETIERHHQEALKGKTDLVVLAAREGMTLVP